MNAYASSVAMDVVARCLSELGGAVGLLHPTFDNIPDLLRSRGLQLVPIEEGELAAGEPYNCLETVAHVFITTPNNPTGAVLEEPALQRLAEQCAERGVTLILDTSFRGFDPRAWYDHYAVLNRAGVDFVVIEDTGKLWPMLELKLGVLVASDRLTNRLCGALSDVLLSVSPLVLALVERLALDFVAGGHNQLHALIARNRSSLGASLARRASGARLADPEARVSVARVELPLGVTAEELCRDLRSARVHLLPGDCFFWARPHDGDRFVRVALARDPDVVDAVAEALSQNLQRL